MLGARARSLALACVLVLLAATVGTIGAAAAASAPPNDSQANAQVIHSLPATIGGTTVGATTEPTEPGSSCESGSASSVWYSLRSPSAQRIAVDLAAAGALDGTIDVYHAVRSQLVPVGCQQTDPHGKASLSFKASKNGLYEIRVAALANSQLAPFTLDVFLPTPAVSSPGVAAPRGRHQRAGRPHPEHQRRLLLLDACGRELPDQPRQQDRRACVSGALFAPGTRSFEEGSSLLHIGCGGYRLFTPGPGQGGLYSFEVTPRGRGVHHFRLQVAPAGRSETAPGLPLANYAHAHGRLNGNGVHVLRLYRLDVTSHSNLTLKLMAPESADFNLQLRNQNGNVIECQCGGSGSQTLEHQLFPGRYYAVVSCARRHRRQLHARARVAHDHLDERSPSRPPRPRPARGWGSTSRSRPPPPVR